MNDWVPDLTGMSGPRYLAFVAALKADVADGIIPSGAQLLPQRDMAQRLGLSVGTISKAYTEAEQRGLIFGEVGRGTFVQRRKAPARYAPTTSEGTVNLALNVPPHTGEDDVIAAVLSEILATDETINLLGYTPHQGMTSHRTAIGSWLATVGLKAATDQIYITHGTQHALSVALNVLARAKDTILCESLTYSGIRALAQQNDYHLHGVRMDEQGLIPDSLDRAFRETGARVLYCMPTLQTPTGAVMSVERRQMIADIVEANDAFLFEDDAYGYLQSPPLAPISSLIPNRSFYALSFAKCLAPGLRIAAMVAPDSYRDRLLNGMRTTGWMAVPMMAEAVARIINNGSLKRQAQLKREKAAIRNEIVRKVLKDWLPQAPDTAPGFHLWLPLPAGRSIDALIAQAAQAGITLAAPRSLKASEAEQRGVRICYGSPTTEADLEEAMLKLRDILQAAETIAFI